MPNTVFRQVTTPAKTGISTAKARIPVELSIDKLKANTRYYYRLRYRKLTQVLIQPALNTASRHNDLPGVASCLGAGRLTSGKNERMFDPELYRQLWPMCARIIRISTLRLAMISALISWLAAWRPVAADRFSGVCQSASLPGSGWRSNADLSGEWQSRTGREISAQWHT